MLINDEYHDLVDYVLEYGKEYEDTKRKGVFRRQIPHWILEYNLLNNPFPLITTKKVSLKNITHELVWFLNGTPNIKYLVNNGVNIWNKDAYAYAKTVGRYPGDYVTFIEDVKKGHEHNGFRLGDVGRIYGTQWRGWKSYQDDGEEWGDAWFIDVDQIQVLIDKMKTNPMSTELLVNAWNPGELHQMALPPCHWSFEILMEPLSLKQRHLYYANLHGDERTKNFVLNTPYDDAYFNARNIPRYGFTLKWHQRSVDVFLGLPYNITSYALMAKLLEKLTGHLALNIVGDLSNVHIYTDHVPMCEKQLNHDPTKYGRNLEINVDSNLKSIDDVKVGTFTLFNYDGSYGVIKAEMYERDTKT